MRRAFCFVVAAAGFACAGEPPARSAPPSLGNDAPVPPGAVRVASAQGADAVEAMYRSTDPPDSVTAWYRRWFLAHQWRITGDTRLSDGTFVLHADSLAKPLWLMIRPAARGATFSVMAAEPGGAR